MIDVPNNLREALRRLSDVRAEMAADADVRSAREAEQVAYHRLEKAKNALERVEEQYRKRIDDLRDYIEANALEVGETFEHAGVKVRVRSGYERVTWDKDRLTDLAAKLRDRGDYTLAAEIEAARRVTEVGPSAKVVD